MPNSFLKKSIAVMLTAVTVLGGSSLTTYAAGLNVEYHSIEEIKNKEKEIIPLMDKADKMAEQPVKTAPYSLGAVSQETKNDTMTILNFVRYVAGVPANVQIKEEYQTLSQGAALINAANGGLSHFPAQAAGMSDAMYQICAEGAGSSNIAVGDWNTYNTILGWMSDNFGSNVSTVGHRRWFLNPTMQYTGIGIVGKYRAMYSLDNAYDANSSGYTVAWPAQNTPVELLRPYLPWSVSFGTILDEGSIQVTLKNIQNGQVWNFSNSAKDGELYVDNGGYGQSGCVIFRPKGIQSYKDGERFSVTITGRSIFGDEVSAAYDVNFFAGYQKQNTVSVKSAVSTSKISLNKKNIKLKKGKKYSLKVTKKPKNTTDTLQFSSSDESIATVNAKGQIKAISPGSAVITVISGSKKATCKISVPGTTDITKVKASLTIRKGKSATLHPKVKYVSSKDKVIYSSSNKNVATVQKNGKIKAKKAGTAIITVRSGKIQKQCNVTVTK